jgi:hypothetical protein
MMHMVANDGWGTLDVNGSGFWWRLGCADILLDFLTGHDVLVSSICAKVASGSGI